MSHWLDRPLFRHLLSEHNIPEAAVDHGSMLSTARSLSTKRRVSFCGGLVTQLSKCLGVLADHVNSDDQAFEYGADSLRAVEFHRWWIKEEGAEASGFVILGNQSIAEVALVAAGDSHFVAPAMRKESRLGRS